MAVRKSQKEDPIVYAGREIKDAYDLSYEELVELVEAAGKEERKTPIYLSSQKRLQLVEEIAEQLVRGWHMERINAFRRKHDLTRRQMESLEHDANKVLRGTFEKVNREDLVARQLHRLERIAEMAVEQNAMSTAQACVASILKTTGADKPEE